MRGRLLIAGIGPRSTISDTLDVLTVILMDTPGEQLEKWRDGLDRAALKSVPTQTAESPVARGIDRAGWGTTPDQIAATQRFHTQMGGA